jgi:hypothetical protein
MSIETIIATTSLAIALLSALFAWFTFKATEKTNNIEIIGNLYETYRSDEMLRDLQIAWEVYHRLWKVLEEPTNNVKSRKKVAKEKGIDNKSDNAENGILLPDNIVIEYYGKLDTNSDEYKAIHNLNNFWTYIQLLLRRKIISPKEILAFTSPRILGLLCPAQKAHDARFNQKENTYANLEYSYKILKVGQQ